MTILYSRPVRFFLFLFVFISLSGCQEAIDRANAFLQAAQGELQSKRAIVISSETLDDIDDGAVPDAVLSLTDADLEDIEYVLHAALANTQAAIDNEVTVNWVNLVFGEQTLTARVSVTKKIKQSRITGMVQASAFVAAAPDGLYWNLYLDGFRITDIDWRFGFVARLTRWAVNQANIFTGIMNAVFDEAINANPDKALFVSVTQDDLFSENLATLSDDKFQLEDHQLELALDSELLAVVITPDGLRLVSDLEFRKPEDVQITPPEFPADSDLIRISDEDADALVERYHATVDDWLGIGNPEVEETYAPDTLAVLKGTKSGTIISGDLLSQALAVATSDVIRGTLSFAETNQSASDLTFSIGRRQCEGYFAACDNKQFCQGNRCREKITETYQVACRIQCGMSTFGFGLLIPKICDGICDRTRSVIRDVAGPACDGFRLASEIHGDLLCKVAEEVDHGVCNVNENVKKAACQIEQEARRFFEDNPIAQVKTDSAVNGKVALAVKNLSLSSDLSEVSIDVSAQGEGGARLSISYDRKNYATALLLPGISLGAACLVDWKEGVATTITTSLQGRRLSFNADWANDDDANLILTLRQVGEETALLNLDPAPIPELFLGKPQVTFNCPLMAVGSAIFGAYEATFTQVEARTVFPLITGDDYPAKISGIDFEAKIEPIMVCPPADPDCQSPLLTLNPTRDGRNVVFAAQ